MTRIPQHRYEDALDRVWIEAAARIGFRVDRTADVYAGTDGRRRISIGVPESLDADDCLAQMILHELCHALVEGEAAWARPDWGLDNTGEHDRPREEACLRLQAALAAPHGLRRFLAPTTEHRPFYDALPVDALAPPGEPTAELARSGLARAARPPFAPHLEEALAATAAIGRAVAPFVAEETLWGAVEAPAPRHPLGFPLAGTDGRTCGNRTWRYLGGRGRAVDRCRQASGARLDPAWPACERWEGVLDCQECGACCREAYHSVTVPPRDPVVRAHPALVVVRDGYVEMRREGDRCAALRGDGSYACAIYEDRPRPCREFERAGGHCLSARRRVGLSR